MFRRGQLTVAVSTGGASPSLAKKVRADLGQRVGSDYIPMLRLLRDLRGIAKRELPKYGDRKKYFDQLVQGKVFDLVRTGKRGAAKQEALAMLKEQADATGQAAVR
jgi:precorrin-2 dehydrogenase/sirohydrochlorin ferrochelatase